MNQEIYNENEQALKEFLLDISCLDQLAEWSDSFERISASWKSKANRDFKFLPHVSQLPVCDGRHGQQSQTCEQINYNHMPVDNHENHDVESPHGNMNEKRLDPQPQQRAKAHGF